MKMSNSKAITVSLRKHCGIDAIHPECATAKLFADVAQTKTLTRIAIDKLRKAGYKIIVKQEEKVL